MPNALTALAFARFGISSGILAARSLEQRPMRDETRRQHIEHGSNSRRFPQVWVSDQPERDGQFGQAFLMGDRFTVADAYCFTIVGCSKFGRIDMAHYSNVRRYMESDCRPPKGARGNARRGNARSNRGMNSHDTRIRLSCRHKHSLPPRTRSDMLESCSPLLNEGRPGGPRNAHAGENNSKCHAFTTRSVC